MLTMSKQLSIFSFIFPEESNFFIVTISSLEKFSLLFSYYSLNNLILISSKKTATLSFSL